MTKSPSNRASALIAAVLAVFGLAQCQGQGTMQFTFEGMAPGSFGTISAYSEAGMLFWNPHGPENLVRIGSGLSGAPDNGSAYLQGSTGAWLAFSLTPVRPFGLSSMDLAEYSTARPGPVTLHVVGYDWHGQGITYTTDITTDGINDGTGPLQDFQTFTFDSRYANLYRVDITTDGSYGFSIDNVAICGVPEPSTGALLLLGAACAFGRSRIKRRRP